MSSMSDYLENKLGDHVLRGLAYTAPANTYVALFTAAPSDAGGGTEVSGGSYARVAIAPANWNGTHGSTTGASSGTGGQYSNAVALTFPAPTANWGTATHFAVFDAATGGNMLFQAALTTSRTINSGDAAPVFNAGGLTFTLA